MTIVTTAKNSRPSALSSLKQRWSRWRRSRPAIVAQATLLAGIGLMGIVTVSRGQGVGKVLEAKPNPVSRPFILPIARLSAPTSAPASASQSASQMATGSSWQGSSFPVENFQDYTSPFGYRRSPDGSYNQEFHRGLDLAAPQGSYIRNWWAGNVVEVSDGTACGTYIVIQSGNWEHLYCHMEGRVETVNGKRYLVDRAGGIQIAQGEAVPAGTRIGRVGMTGRTTGPHLHWGLKYSGQWVDPALVLQAMYAEQTRSGTVSQR